MSSPETESLFADVEALEGAKKVVDRLIVQVDHLGVHIDRNDQGVVEYWFNHIRRSLTKLSFDLEEKIRSWRDV